MPPLYITEHTLLERNVKGLKKLSNFLKREEERQAWWVLRANVEQCLLGIEQHLSPRMSMATPEDVDYAQCQEQLNQDLLKEHLLVERVIGQPGGRGIGQPGGGA